MSTVITKQSSIQTTDMGLQNISILGAMEAMGAEECHVRVLEDAFETIN